MIIGWAREWFVGNHFLILILSLLLTCFDPCHAQHTKQDAPAGQPDITDLSQRFYGSDDLLVSGSVYIPSSPLISNHPYFDREDWFESTVFIDGRKFDHQEIKYNLVTRKMILKAVFKEGATVKIVLNTWKIDSLYLGDHIFFNSNHLSLSESDTSFFELIHRNGFVFVSNYHKEFINKYSSSTPYGLWSSQAASHYIYTDAWHPVSSKRSLLACFPAGKEEIRRYMHKNHIRFGKATSDQLKLLLAHCSSWYQK